MREKIWIDLDNTPHVPFFEPIISSLREKSVPTIVTARDAFQVHQLAESKGLKCKKIGKHYGKNKLMKGVGLIYRALQLAPYILKEKPILGISHGARSQLILGKILHIPTLLIEDYEYCEFPWIMRSNYVMAPNVIPENALPVKKEHIIRYSGIKENVYAWNLNPDPNLLKKFDITTSEIMVTVRPPATEAHYHNPESEDLFVNFMNRACLSPHTKVILLPRNRRQATTIRKQWPEWFQSGKTQIPTDAIDGLNLIWYSDLVVSGGGTMNREAAALEVPVYSIFRGHIGAVDRQLCKEGKLILIESLEDVREKIRITKRLHRPINETTSRATFNQVVSGILNLYHSLLPGRVTTPIPMEMH